MVSRFDLKSRFGFKLLHDQLMIVVRRGAVIWRGMIGEDGQRRSELRCMCTVHHFVPVDFGLREFGLEKLSGR